MRPQTHLAEIERSHGSGDATDELRAILTRGLFALEEEKRATRIAERGDALKHNPFVSDAGKCLRAVTYSLRNIEASDPTTEDSLMNFLVGHSVESAWAAILTAAGAEFVREERVSIPVGTTVVTGRKDFAGIRMLWRGSIVELKSTNSRAMGWMLKRGECGKDEHRRQLNLYLYAEQVDVGYLVYLVKDATKGEPILHAWAVERDDDKARNDLQALSGAHEIAQRGKIAPIPEGNSQKAYPCTYCDFRTRCWLEASIDLATEASDAAVS